MKQIYLTLLLLLCVIIPHRAFAQTALPTDSEVRIGKLDNGMTYYIRHNETPKGRADFYIVQKVGSILENDNQRGLAHFLEHMCFNGTKHFPDKKLLEWCQSVGIKFGDNINAYTGWDQTVYQLMNVPVKHESVQDSCLLILHDWAAALTLSDKEIDAERNVIHQEWRSRNIGEQRLREQMFPIIMPGNKYALRFPIGTMEVVDNFPYQALRDYYKTWYRPDLQAIIVVGDIDIDNIERKIKAQFSHIKMPANAPERKYVDVEDTPGTIFAIGSDKELPSAKFELYFKQDPFPEQYKNTDQYMAFNYITNMISFMLNNRLSEQASRPDAPYTNASSFYSILYMAKTKEAFTLRATAKGGDIRPAFETVYREVIRAKRGGFTVSEYEQAKAQYLSRYEMFYNNRNHRTNENLLQDCINNFLDSEPLISADKQWELARLFTTQIPLELINRTMTQLISEDNRAALIFVPEKEGFTIPTQQQMNTVMESVNAENIEPYTESIKTEPLITKLPTPGKIISTSHNDTWNATVWTLSNGAKVIIKPTTLKNDEILFSACAKGGTNIIDDTYLHDLKFMPYALTRHGFGSYDNLDMTKYLNGKMAGLSYDFRGNSRNIDGMASSKDLRVLMELIYSAFTSFTLTDNDFSSTQSTYENLLPNQESNPEYVFSKYVRSSLYKNPRNHVLDIEDIKSANKNKIEEIVQSMVADINDFTFIFTGSIDIDSLRPLVEQYIACIPNSGSGKCRFTDLQGTGVTPGTGSHSYSMKMETPQTWVWIEETGDMPFNLKNLLMTKILAMTITDRLIKTVREEMGAVYSLEAYGNMQATQQPNTHIYTAFPMKPEFKDQVINYITGLIKELETTITPEDIKQASEFILKTHKENSEVNAYWLNSIKQWLQTGQDMVSDMQTILESITITDLRNHLKQLNRQGNYRIVTLEAQ